MLSLRNSQTAALFLFFFLLSSSVIAADRNVNFIFTDDESPTLGCSGDPVAVTPAIDAIAADGVIFRNAYATTASPVATASARRDAEDRLAVALADQLVTRLIAGAPSWS